MVNRTESDAHTPVPSTRRSGGGPFTRWPRAADSAVCVVVFLLIVLVTPVEPDDDLALRSLGSLSIAELVVLVTASGVLYWRRVQPLVVLGVTLLTSSVSDVFGWSELAGVAMLVALYSDGRHVSNGRWSLLGLGGALAYVTASSIADVVPVVEIGFGQIVTVMVWYVGRRLRVRAELAAQRDREQEAQASRAVAEERTRIARELHDIVAHRVSLMTVQAGAARTVVAVDPQGAATAMAAVEKAGRQALDELRHLLGVLRPEAEAETLNPQPGLGDVPRLVDQFRAAGLEVALTTDGGEIGLPALVHLSAYRIIQEALTNTLKHAGSNAETEVRLSSDNRHVTIEVLDRGQGVTTLPGSGHGIVGMRERALLLGGRLDAGPRPDGGFRVVAQLPVGDEPA